MLAMTSCDLKSCYNRICHMPAIPAMSRMGMPLPTLQSSFLTIQNAQHRTRTFFGDSKSTYGVYEDPYIFPPQGVGQGNGAGPAVCS